MDSDTKKTTSDKQKPAKARRTRKVAADESAKTKTRVTKTTRSKASSKKEAVVAVAPVAPEAKKARKSSVRVKKELATAQAVEAEQPKPRRGRKPKQKPTEETVSLVATPVSQDKQTVKEEAPSVAPVKEVAVSHEEKQHHAKKGDNRPEKKKDEANPVFAQPETVGGGDDEHTGGRRKRRRRNRRNGQGEGNAPQSGNLPAVNIKKLHRRAWQIFLGEVTEEGLALMDDATARETARRSYRVAEFFLIEAARHDKKVRPNEAPSESGEPATE